MNALVGTDLYLPLAEENTYSSDWQILDPFGRGNSVHLKLYVENCKDETLKNKIHDDFAIVKTSESRTYGEIQNQIEKNVSEIINKDFNKCLEKIEESLLTYLQLIVKMRLCMEYSNYSSRDYCDSYASYLQQLIEGILITDQLKREKDYNDLKYIGQAIIVGTKLHKICKSKFGLEIVPKSLSAQREIKNGKSLLFYLMEFILTCEKSTPSLFPILKDHIQTICDIAETRNSRQHYGLPKLLTQKEVERFYNCIKTIINNYVQ